MTGAAAAISGDPTLALAIELIACRSITPDDGGSLALIARRLSAAGFTCERLDRRGVGNLWATHGTRRPIVCLAGHVDVVPPGPSEGWSSDPFVPEIRNGRLFGRGAADMKGSVAAMVVAAERIAAARPGHPGTVAILLTADEEGEARDGTLAAVDVLQSRGVRLDACIVGEPTSTSRFGDTIKNGRRGSLNGVLRIQGTQCHIAYPERGRNPIHAGLAALAELAATTWDEGTPYFPPTSFQISNVHAGTGATNVIPGTMEVVFNFRHSPASPADALKVRVAEILGRHQVAHDLRWTVSGDPFLTGEGPLIAELRAVVRDQAGVTPTLSTTGGTSDGRFLAKIADEVVEFGPSNATIHQTDEHVPVAELAPLAAIFERTVTARLHL